MEETVELDYITMTEKMAANEIKPEYSVIPSRSSREKYTPHCGTQKQDNSEYLSLDCRPKDKPGQDKGAQNLYLNPQNASQVDIEETIFRNSDRENDDLRKMDGSLFEKESEHLDVFPPACSTSGGILNPVRGREHGYEMAITTEKRVSEISDMMGDYCQLKHDDTFSAQRHLEKEHRKDSRILTCTGMTTIDGDRIVIVTKCGQIIVLRSDGLFLFLKEFEESFGDVATVDSNEIVTSCGFRVSFFLVLGTEIKEEKGKCIDFLYEETTVHGISHSAQKLLMSCNLQSVVLSHTPSLKLYDMKRKVTKTFDNLRFKYPGRVLLNTDASIIYVADQMEKTVTCLDANGRELWKTFETNSPISITLSEDTLLVAFEGAVEITCLFSRNGTVLKSVPVNGTFLSKEFLLAQNATNIIVCPSDHTVDGISNLVLFSRIKHTYKHDMFAKIAHVKMLMKAFR